VEPYEIDVIIPVHSTTRPLKRAVSSVLDNTTARVRVIVIAHNIGDDVVKPMLGEFIDHPDINMYAYADHIHSCAGPKNFGFSQSTADYVSFLDSDDEFEKGALDSWLQIAQRESASTVIAKMKSDDGTSFTDPPTRPGRFQDLNPVKDRLTYRSHTVGLISRKYFVSPLFTEGLVIGEDLEFSNRLWFTGSRIAYDRTGPAYILHTDASDRITHLVRPLETDFAFVDHIEKSTWFVGLSNRAKRAIGIKIIRVHFFDALASRMSRSEGIGFNREEFLTLLARIEHFAPGSTALLSRPDRKTLDELRKPIPDPIRIQHNLASRWFGLKSLLPRNLWHTFHPQAPYRTLKNMIA
jgi:glycosyltransferase involved in cell wall biosynthesis